ncbi:MAG: hypothetical protein JOZ81_33450 [Chloroflexi bacterium]|nr:hypothetical protein [Chloroflexota bacterium]
MSGSRIILAAVLFTLIFSAGLIPNHLLLKQLGLLNNYASLIPARRRRCVQPGRGAPVFHRGASDALDG